MIRIGKRKFLLLIVLFLVLLFTGIKIVLNYKNSPETVFKENVVSVLVFAFTGPDELISQSASQDESNPVTTPLEKLTQLYSPYFTEKGLTLFIAYYSSIGGLDRLCIDSSWKTSVDKPDKIKITPYHDSGDYYDYSVPVAYWKEEGKKSEIIITGRVRMEGDGKIGFWNLSPQSIKDVEELKKLFGKDRQSR